MKKLLFIAVLLIGISPQSVRAETWWLLIGGRNGGRYESSATITQLPTNSLEECSRAGDKLINSKKEPSNIHGAIFSHMRYVCIQGK